MRTIAARLLMAFLCVIVFLVLQGVSAHLVTTHISEVQRDALSVELQIEDLKERLARTRLTVFKLLGTMDPHEMDLLRGKFEERIDSLSRDLAAEGLSQDLVRENEALYRRIIRLHYDFSVRTARALIDGPSKDIHDEIAGGLEERSADLAAITKARIGEAHEKAHLISLGLFLCALAAAGIWAFILMRTLTDRRKAEESLRESESRFRSLFDFSPQGIALTELETGRLLDVNARFCELTGYDKEEVLGKSTAGLFYSPGERERFLDELEEKGEVHGMEMAYRGRDGAVLQAVVFSKKIELADGPVLLTIFLDMTRQKRLEAQLQQAHRLESIGTLAGGIAHDFNNLLMGIQGRVSLMLVDLEDSHPHYEHLKGIEEHVRSASDMTRQLLGFARGGKYEVKPTDPNDLVRRTVEMFGRTRKDITIRMDLPGDVGRVEADRRQIEQVLFNLYVNASQAMPEEGEIQVRTENVVLDARQASLYQTGAGNYVCIRVEDTGVGMDSETLKHIFDPFFTTKEMGRGTGLGLASAYGIVKNHSGFIDVSSTPGKGSVFSVYLPATNRKGRETRIEETEVASGSGTVLLVEDEEAVADVAARMIRKIGYEVLTAGNGREA
ncbi:MAG: ATP-binding protein, partial [Desulfobacteraceae bacterium]